jgi:hypothetical protein
MNECRTTNSNFDHRFNLKFNSSPSSWLLHFGEFVIVSRNLYYIFKIIKVLGRKSRESYAPYWAVRQDPWARVHDLCTLSLTLFIFYHDDNSAFYLPYSCTYLYKLQLVSNCSSVECTTILERKASNFLCVVYHVEIYSLCTLKFQSVVIIDSA